MGAAWCFVCHLHGQLGVHAVLHSVPGRLHRGVWLEPRRKLHCLFGVSTDRWGDVATRGYPGGSTWTSAAGPDRRRPPGAWPAWQLVCSCPLGAHPALRCHHDARGELPRTGCVRPTALATLRTEPGDGSSDRAVGQWLRARIFRTGVAVADHRPWLARGGLMAAAVLPLAALFRGTEPPRAVAIQTTAQASWTLSRAMRTPHFWLLFLVYVFTGLGSFLVALHQLAFAVTVGFDKLYAAGVLGLGAFLSLPGVILTGWLSDRIGRELSAVITYGTSIFGVACAMFISGPDQHLLLWLHSCFFGLTWGARGPSITAKTADLYPGPQLGTILGAITIGTGIGSALGSWLAGWSFDLTGSYRVAFGLSIFFYACGSVAFWLLRRPVAKEH